MPSPKQMLKARARAKNVRRENARRLRNRTARSESRTLVSRARNAIDGGDRDEAAVAVKRATTRLDTAAGKHVIHKGNAARRKSRLMAMFNSKFAEKAAPKTRAKPKRSRKKSA